MATINLTATDSDQELILAYLTENASDVLANKINNGTAYEKDGKQLVNKKDLNGFMKFAGDEALKLIAQNERKGTVVRCLDDSTVYGWAIHYFEEDSIVGKLYNQDGTEYKPPAPVKKTAPLLAKPTPPPKPKTQFSFFDMLERQKDEQKPVELQANDNELIDKAVQHTHDSTAIKQTQPEPTPPPLQPVQQEQPKPKNELYEKYSKYASRYPGSVIAMRVGDFFEILGKNAVTISEEVGLTLTSRDLGLEQRIPMIGFPYHAAELYFKKLRQKHSVVVVDTGGERKLEEFGLEDILDGDNELTEEEMRLFDGDISEPKEVIDTPSCEQAEVDCKSDDDCPYDEVALKKVVKLLGDSFILR